MYSISNYTAKEYNKSNAKQGWHLRNMDILDNEKLILDSLNKHTFFKSEYRPSTLFSVSLVNDHILLVVEFIVTHSSAITWTCSSMTMKWPSENKYLQLQPYLQHNST